MLTIGSRQITLKNLLLNNKNNNIFIKDCSRRKNIFIIGIDGMISTSMYTKYFNSSSVATTKLKELGFAIFDINSAGESTLETYSKLVTYKNHIGHPRNFKNSFISSSSRFYIDSKLLGYKKQFIFYSNYFGGDPNNIFDRYYPKENKPFGFILFTDDRWGWYFVKLIKYLYRITNYQSEIKDQKDLIKSELKKINFNSDKWISISHLWFPGHTAGNYTIADSNSFYEYKKYYQHSQYELSIFFQQITELIHEFDSNAIIIFMGDHGSYLLKGGLIGSNIESIGKIDKNLLERDRKEILLGIFPNNIFDSSDLGIINKRPELLFNIILNKACGCSK